MPWVSTLSLINMPFNTIFYTNIYKNWNILLIKLLYAKNYMNCKYRCNYILVQILIVFVFLCVFPQLMPPMQYFNIFITIHAYYFLNLGQLIFEITHNTKIILPYSFMYTPSYYLNHYTCHWYHNIFSLYLGLYSNFSLLVYEILNTSLLIKYKCLKWP